MDRMGYGFGDQGVLLNDTVSFVDPSYFQTELHDFAAENDVNITLREISASIPDNEEHYFSTDYFQEDPKEIASFGNDKTRIIYPFSDLHESDNRGLYILEGPAGSDILFLAWANQIGLDGLIMQTNFWNIIGQSPYLITGLLMIIAALFLAATHEIIRGRATAIKRLLGRPLHLNLLDEYLSSWKIPLLSIGLSLFSTIAILSVNGFAQTPLFFGIYFASLLLGILGLVLGQLVGHFIAVSIPLNLAIKGERAGLLLNSGMLATRLITLFFFLGIIGSLTGNLSELRAQTTFSTLWDTHKETYRVSIASAAGQDFYGLAETLRTMDRHGEIILADRQWLTAPLDIGAPVVLSNTTFAVDEGLLAPKDLPQSDEITILHPQFLDSAKEPELLGLLEFEASNSQVPMPKIQSIPYDSEDSTNPMSEVFTYNINLDSAVRNPIVVILPAGLELLSDQNLSARLTQNSLLIKDQTGVNALLSSEDSRNYVGAASPMIDTWEESVVRLKEANQIIAFNAFIALFLTTTLVLATALVFHLRNQRRLWVAHLLGNHPLRARLQLLIVEVIFASIPCVWLANRYFERSAAIASDAPSARYLEHLNSIPPSLPLVLGILIIGWTSLSFFSSMKLPFEKSTQ